MTKTILIVEDDEGLRDILRIVLHTEGFRVQICENGQRAMEALELAKANHTLPAMIILDLAMPIVDGWTVAKWLDADPILGDIPVVVTSATPEQGERAKALHADAYLLKPYSTDEILGVVELFSLLSS